MRRIRKTMLSHLEAQSESDAFIIQGGTIVILNYLDHTENCEFIDSQLWPIKNLQFCGFPNILPV